MATKKAETQKQTTRRKTLGANAKIALGSKKNLLGKNIKSEQWDLPVAFRKDGETFATLREVVDPNVVTLSLADLSGEKRKNLIVERLERKPNFTINMIGAGVVDKKRAIEEVKAQTPAGKVIEEIEQRVINNMLVKAKLQEG